MGKKILFKRGGRMLIEVYTDVDYAGSEVDTRSIMWYCTFLAGNLIT